MAQDPHAPARELALPPGTRVAAVVSSYHAELCGAMERSARRTLEAAGLAAGDFLRIDAPGAFELPLLARRFARRDDVHAVLCFGLVLKGETTHDRYVAGAAADGCLAAALETDTPILFGVLTCNTLEQARARALSPEEGGQLDKGHEVALAAIGVLNGLTLADTLGREASR